jgi:RNA polymerase sigma factor (sigma-70 family)
MPDVNDMDLMREYTDRNSEPAFAELVHRHINLVYSVALRYTGNSQDAQDVTQAVFVILAQKAESLRQRTSLTGWMYETTRFIATRFLRTRARQQAREQEAYMQSTLNDSDAGGIWRRLAPQLEEAMTQLNEKERALLALRFFENKSAAETAALLGIREWAAHKRAARAVEKLRRFFAKRGVEVAAGVLTAAISANSVQAAPAALAKTATAVAITKGAAAGGSTLTLIQGAMKVMAWTKVKTGMVSAAVAASLLVPFVVQHQARAREREGDESLRRQGEQLIQLQAEHDRLSKLVANSSLSQDQLDDLQRLRSEAGPLRQQANAVAQLREENRRLKAKTGQDRPKTPVQLKEEAITRMSYGRNWVVGFYQYAGKHQGQFPTNFEQAADFVPDKVKNQSGATTDQLEIVFQGSPALLERPQDIIVIREREAWNAGETSHPPGQWAKIYTFADGHSEIHLERENNFDAYEQQHTMAPPANPQ